VNLDVDDGVQLGAELDEHVGEVVADGLRVGGVELVEDLVDGPPVTGGGIADG
jgi:hypothetical protein